jgi:MOSC domain-containing protein YiiM
MKILSVCTGKPERLAGKTYNTGINKRAANGALMIRAAGLEDDAVCNRKYHGGPDQAAYIEGGVTLDWWATELGRPLHPGQFGENLIIAGLDNVVVAAGDCLGFGDVILQATAPRMPCTTFAAKMADPHFVRRYRKAARPGFYCRVIREGTVEVGMEVSYRPYEGLRVPMTELMKSFGKIIHDDTLARYLAAPIHGKLRSSLGASGKVKF